jgi:anti-sigma factor ChrR (cupin superfamily)
MAWQPGRQAGTEVKRLYSQPGYSDTMAIERWPRGFDGGERAYPLGAELLVTDGSFGDERGRYASGTWIRLPEGSSHSPRTNSGCTLYIKEGGHAYLAAG